MTELVTHDYWRDSSTSGLYPVPYGWVSPDTSWTGSANSFVFQNVTAGGFGPALRAVDGSIGSGGSVFILTTASPSGASFIVSNAVDPHDGGITVSESRSVKTPVARSVAEQVDFVRDALSLTVTQLAEILGVSRPTVYAWAEGQTPRFPIAQSRLKELHWVAQEWALRSTESLAGLIRVSIEEGPSLLDLLRADVVNRPAILEGLDALKLVRDRENAERQDHEPKSVSQIAELHGFPPKSEADRGRSLRDFARSRRRIR